MSYPLLQQSVFSVTKRSGEVDRYHNPTGSSSTVSYKCSIDFSTNTITTSKDTFVTGNVTVVTKDVVLVNVGDVITVDGSTYQVVYVQANINQLSGTYEKTLILAL